MISVEVMRLKNKDEYLVSILLQNGKCRQKLEATIATFENCISEANKLFSKYLSLV